MQRVSEECIKYIREVDPTFADGDDIKKQTLDKVILSELKHQAPAK